jgi:hypothetical protein
MQSMASLWLANLASSIQPEETKAYDKDELYYAGYVDN